RAPTPPALAGRSAAADCELLNVDEVEARPSAERPVMSVGPDTLAYIVYTSGSTGRPKGIFQNHRNVLHKIMTPTNDFHICPDDRLSLLYSCSVGVGIRNM